MDILTDSDGDGVSDVNEWIAGGWRPGGGAPAPDPAQDPGSTPSGPSEIDLLWLYPESLEATDRAAEYRHAGAVAGRLFADSGIDIRLRTAGVATVPDGSVGGEHPVDPVLMTELANEHGADVVSLMYDSESKPPLCRGGGGICAAVWAVDSGLFLPFGAPGEHERLGMMYRHGADEGVFSGIVAHELGHVFGLAHSAAQGEAYGTFRHSRGHFIREHGAYPGTIMSYGDFSATPVFSSPASGLCEPLGPCGLPAGHPKGADAVSSINIMRFQIAAVRDPKPGAGGDGADGGPALHAWFRSTAVQAAFEEALGKPAEEMSEEDVQGIDSLTVDVRRGPGAGPGVTEIDLAGLERATGLRTLFLWGDRGEGLRASDLSPLADLPLRSFAIYDVAVRDIQALSRLRHLSSLYLRAAGINDGRLRGLVAAVRGHGALRTLDLTKNLISDPAPLCGLAGLSSLYLDSNSVRDARPLKCHTDLQVLSVSYNDMGAASLLAAVRAMPGLRGLGISGNPLSLDDFLEGAPEGLLLGTPAADYAFLRVQALGVSDLSRLGDFLAGLKGRKLDLWLGSNPFHDLGPVVREDIWRNGGSVSLWNARLDGASFGPGGHMARLREFGVEVEHAPSEPFRAHSFQDGALGTLVAAETAAGGLGGLVETPITPARLERLVRLHAGGRGISDLSGLEAASRLEYAHLAANRVSDLSPLLGLNSLKETDLDGNPLSETALNEQVPDLLSRGVSVVLGAVSWAPVAGRGGAAAFRTDGYFAARLGVADASGITFMASTDREALRPGVSVDGALTVAPVRLAGPATVTVTAEAVGADPVALDFHIVSLKRLPLLLADRGPSIRQGFLRVVNHSGRAGDVIITARDGAGTAFGPITLPLEGRQAVHLNSRDLESGNPAKGLREGLGDGQGDWRLTLEGRLNAEALAYVRTTDGFVTAMHDVAPKADGGDRELLFFNPGSNHRQESVLRLINDGGAMEGVRLTAIDDAGAEGAVVANVPAGEALRLTAAELESGAAPGLSGALGDGSGKWRLRIEAGPDITAMGLLETPTGHLANLSAPPAEPGADGVVRLPLFLSASEPSREGFMRVVNRSERAGTVAMTAFDDRGREHGPVRFSLGPREAKHLNSGDLESGNAAKGLEGSLGAGSGHWRLALDGGGLDFEALAYVRTNDGFVTAMHEAAPGGDGMRRIAFLNPGSNHRQESVLRLVNPNDAPAVVTVAAVDDAGRAGGSPITIELPAGQAEPLTAKTLEAGSDGLPGSLGDGQGKWRLCIEADLPITAMSLLETPTGHLTNLSGSPDLADCAAAGAGR